MSNIIRRRVSQNRKRLVEGRYDLDLTYVGERIIAMGYPSDKPIQSLIRNQIEQVSKFLEEKHRNHYLIFNLCIESEYDFKYFNQNVVHIKLEDHNPPSFEQIILFCSKVKEWLDQSEDNFAAVHCKAGKGRTGTMISCYFLFENVFNSPFDAMLEFSKQRCLDSKGVTIPSQRRYVEYYHDYLKNNRNYYSKEIDLKSIIVIQPNNSDMGNFKHLSFKVFKDSAPIYESQLVKSDKENENFIFKIDPLHLSGDIKISFFDKKKEKVFNIWLNTFGLSQENENALNELSNLGIKKLNSDGTFSWSLRKKSIDMICKVKNIHSDFEVEMTFLPKSDNSIVENVLYNGKYQRIMSDKSYFLDKKTGDLEKETIKSKEDEIDIENDDYKLSFKNNQAKRKNFLFKFFSRVSGNKISKTTNLEPKAKSVSIESIKSQP